MLSPSLHCPRFDAIPRDWPEIDAAFASLPGTSLRQAWRESPEPGFRPALARLAHHADALWVEAELEDDDVFNPVTGFNQPAFLQGDVVEVFVLPEGMDRYGEIHAAPTGAVLQLRFPVGWRQKEKPPFEGNPWDHGIAEPVTKVTTRLTPAGWSAFLVIPFALLGAVPQPGSVWFVSVCRYDYTRGRAKPVLSSTSALPRVDFHQTDCWNRLVF